MIAAGTNRERWEKSLKICLLTYRGNPASGGQGVYINQLSKALVDLGHRVSVIAGPPYPEMNEAVFLKKLPGLDLYNPDHLFKVDKKRDLFNPLNLFEFTSMCAGGFPEPLTFSIRAARCLSRERPEIDIIHDNQGLGYGLLALKRLKYPLVATIHHPLTVDRATELGEAKSWKKRFQIRRWYSFLGMQMRVARRINRIITVSEASLNDISSSYLIKRENLRVVPNGINCDFFHPLPEIPRQKDHLLVTNSADTPLKGLRYLLEAVAAVKRKRSVKLTVIGSLKKDSPLNELILNLGLNGTVRFTGRIRQEEFAGYYAAATAAVIPSLYEGFGMPAGEAMACGVPVIATSGGALPEIIGEAGIIVPPGDKEALAKAICDLLDDPGRQAVLSEAGSERLNRLFTWKKAAERTVEVYREAIDDYRRS